MTQGGVHDFLPVLFFPEGMRVTLRLDLQPAYLAAGELDFLKPVPMIHTKHSYAKVNFTYSNQWSFPSKMMRCNWNGGFVAST
jgi:hypothetical protein